MTENKKWIYFEKLKGMDAERGPFKTENEAYWNRGRLICMGGVCSELIEVSEDYKPHAYKPTANNYKILGLL